MKKAGNILILFGIMETYYNSNSGQIINESIKDLEVAMKKNSTHDLEDDS